MLDEELGTGGPVDDEPSDGSAWGAWAKLYVAGDSAYSVIALTNLRSALKVFPAARTPKLQVIDVLEFPMSALQDRVFVTPTLILSIEAAGTSEEITSTMIGDLSNTQKIESFFARLLA